MLLLPALRNISIPWSSKLHFKYFSSKFNRKSTQFFVDTSGLLNIGNKWPSKEELIKIESFKEPITPLVLELRNIIRLRGPLSVHDYMSQALHHSQHGYYQNRETKKIGEFGDFITSPEISQVFGELLALWAIMIWEDMECPVKFNLVELGPGNGILMKDMLRIANKFAAFKSAINIHMIELSEVMQNVQKSQLGCESTNGVSTNESITRTSCGIPIVWHKYLKELPSGPAIFFGHEILDAFPVHQFIRTGSQPWREKYVDVDFSTPSRLHFKFVKSPARTSALTLLMDKYKTNDIQNESSFSKIKTMKPPFKDNINSATGVVTVPDEMDTSQLKDNDKSSKDASYGPQDKSDAEDNLSNDFKDVVASKDDGETKEVSPLALSTVEELARRVADHKGAILLIDYGQKDPKVR